METTCLTNKTKKKEQIHETKFNNQMGSSLIIQTILIKVIYKNIQGASHNIQDFLNLAPPSGAIFCIRLGMSWPVCQ